MFFSSDSMNFIIISRQSWEEKNLGSNIQDIARHLAKNHRVVFVNDCMKWSSLLPNKSSQVRQRNEFIEQHEGKHFFEAEENLWVLYPKNLLGSFNWITNPKLYDYLNRYNGRQLVSEIKAAVKQLKWDSYVVLNDNDMLQGFYLKELLNPKLYIYYLRDNFLAVDYWKRHGERLEPQLMSKVDLIASNSIYLANRAARYNPNSVYVGQGCDLKLFDLDTIRECPPDLAALPRPRIGYAGALTRIRLDVDLIEAVAKERPEWQVVLIGSPDETFPKERLDALPNITFLGPKSPQQIPAYLAYMDVLINPQELNEVTIGNYPRKIDEYLAMGKPVVAVKTETMALFEKHVYLADSKAQFIAYIADALEGQQLSSPEDRIAFAFEHTWENSVGSLVEAVNNMLASMPQII